MKLKNFTFYNCFFAFARMAAVTLMGQEKKVYDAKGSLPGAGRAFAQLSLEIGQKEAFVEFLGDWGTMFGPD